mmetsp:Transcript_18248/g.20287  ORF Transcript_18248/g.20287 Transcript_18248/m.20287 type:complete len:297 (+) Transcript_18248:68-958(+)
MAYLVSKDQQSILLSTGTTDLGRGSDSTLGIADQHLSRHHCKLFRSEDVVMASFTGANQMFLKRPKEDKLAMQKGKRYVVHPGDELWLLKEKYCYTLVSELNDIAPPSPDLAEGTNSGPKSQSSSGSLFSSKYEHLIKNSGSLEPVESFPDKSLSNKYDDAVESIESFSDNSASQGTKRKKAILQRPTCAKKLKPSTEPPNCNCDNLCVTRTVKSAGYTQGKCFFGCAKVVSGCGFFQWKGAPLCDGHNLPCSRQVCSRVGRHRGKHFWACSKKKLDDCRYFSWIDEPPYTFESDY